MDVSYRFFNLNTSTSIADDNGRSVRVVLVFSFVMKFLRSHAIEALVKQMKGVTLQWVNDNLNFRWILPYPATWSEKAQQKSQITAN
ncbi:hypothetical protein KUTeg_024562 [Tegillarca granosa]|uniref:Uncharacterized protein n=1 Tax=Tegillarca granosa TaxID=220873 RepID=A0ABQ9E2T5_TEGGR|nr:hypothetical protein KUTeg_024562 [Tegillarca granosa]